MQRSYICKKLNEMLETGNEKERKNISDILERYIRRKKISSIPMENTAKNLVLTKIKAFADNPGADNKKEVIKLISYLQEGYKLGL